MLSVVAATKNRPDRLRRLLDALDAQERAPEFEVVVVADGATPEVLAVLDERARKEGAAPSFRAERLHPGRGPAAARNVGWRAAAGDVIAFTDDDCEPTPGWLAALAAADGDVVQGRVEPHPDERDGLGPFSRSLWVRAAGPYFQTANIRYPRTLLEELGGFDEAFGFPAGEDTDLGWRALEAGASTAFAPGALVHHAVHDFGPLGLARDAHRWGTAVRVVRRHPGIRAHLHRRLFWKSSHERLLVTVAAALVSRRAGLAAATWWAAGHRAEHPAIEALVPALPAHLLVDSAEILAMARGSLRERTLLI